MTFDFSGVFENVEKIKGSLHSDKNNGYFTWRPMHIYDKTSLSSSWNEKSFRQELRENLNTHFMFSIPPPPHQQSCRLWDNVEIYGESREVTDNSIIRRTRIACWITKATDTNSEYVILIDYPRQQWLREEASMLLLYMHCLSCCLLKSVRGGSGDRLAPYSMGTDGSFTMGKTAGAWRYVTYISCKVKNQWRRTVTLHSPSRCEQGRLYIYRHWLKARNDAGSRTIIESQKSRYRKRRRWLKYKKNTTLQLFWCQT
jgi:hypothetical protein